MSGRKKESYPLDFEDVSKSLILKDYLGASRAWYSIFEREKRGGRMDGEFPDSFIDLGLEVNEKAFTEMYVHTMVSRKLEPNTFVFFDIYTNSMLLKLGKEMYKEVVKVGNGMDKETVKKLSKKLSKAQEMLLDVRETFNL